MPLIKHRVSSPRCVSPSSSSGLSLANSLTRSCGKSELPTRQYTVLNSPYRSINVPQVINLNIECHDCLFDFLLARAPHGHVPSTRLILTSDATPDDEVTLANLPFYLDLYISFVASMTDKEAYIWSTPWQLSEYAY